MARRTEEKPLLLTPNTRSALRDKHLRLHRGLLAFWWNLVLICSALSCGYCGAETEFSILEEAQVLADQMKKLSSQELGVFTMQAWCYSCHAGTRYSQDHGTCFQPQLQQHMLDHCWKHVETLSLNDPACVDCHSW